jgi:uncharacterized membrane protein
MTKMQFLMTLHDRLSGLPKNEIEERLNFYSEMIEDRMEEGLREEDAVAAVGSIEDIATHILAEVPLMKIAKEKIKPKRQLKTWEIVLLAVGSPVWASLLIGAAAAVLSVYAGLWSVVISLWACFGALIGCCIGGIVCGTAYICAGSAGMGIALTGLALVAGSLGIYLFFGCKYATKAAVALAKLFALGIKKKLVRKEVDA